MTIKIMGDRLPPPEGKQWRTLNHGMSIEVAGLRHRRNAVASFIKGAERAGRGGFGVVPRREPHNRHSPTGTATAVDGWWIGSWLFRPKRRTVHLGYLPEWASQECLLDRWPEPAIHLDLYSCYLGHDGFVDVDIIVRVERSADEAREHEAELAAKELRKLCWPGLKVLAKVAAMSDRSENDAEAAIMANYVSTRASHLKIEVDVSKIAQIVEAAQGLAPSDQAVMAAVRGMATDDQALEDMFRAGIAMGRLDGIESAEEVKLLRRILVTARRRRAKSLSE